MTDAFTIDYLASRIELLLKPISSDDDPVLLDLIKDEILVQRSKLLGQLLKSRMDIGSGFYQRYCCAPVSCEVIACEGQEVETGLFEVSIPALLRTSTKSVRFVGMPGSHSYSYVDSLENQDQPFPYLGGASHQPLLYTILGEDKLLLNRLVTPMQKTICVEGLFANPTDEALMQCSESKEFPMPKDYMSDLERMVVQVISTRYYSYPDQSNDNALTPPVSGRKK